VKHFYRTDLAPAAVLEAADAFFPELALTLKSSAARRRVFAGELGELELSVKAEGGHYAFVEAGTDQIGESRLDRNVKRFFVQLHRLSDPRHKLDAAY
jgi:hypothetical protein